MLIENRRCIHEKAKDNRWDFVKAGFYGASERCREIQWFGDSYLKLCMDVWQKKRMAAVGRAPPLGHQFHSRHIKMCTNSYTNMRTNLRPLRTINGTTMAYFCTHNSSYLYAASPGSGLALASPLMGLWRNGYDRWIQCINRVC
jgi:hypothetical protein